jgi:hypothetical protein
MRVMGVVYGRTDRRISGMLDKREKTRIWYDTGQGNTAFGLVPTSLKISVHKLQAVMIGQKLCSSTKHPLVSINSSQK